MIDKIISFGLHNRLLMIALAVLVMAAGFLGYTRLPVNAFPDVSPNLVQVFTVTEGLAPEEVEKFVTFPVEAAMTGLPGVTGTRSVSNFGLSVVSIYFQDDLDIYFARQLVGERLQEAREQIPEGFGEPESSYGILPDPYADRVRTEVLIHALYLYGSVSKIKPGST